MKTKKKLVLVILLIVLTITLCCGTYYFYFTDSGKGSLYTKIVYSSGKKINTNGNFQELKSIEEDLSEYEVYLTGEAHGIDLCYEAQKYITKYLVENQGVKYILLESSVSIAELLNGYLKTGDDEILKKVMLNYEGSPAYNQGLNDLYEFYYEYNKQLPEGKKLTFVGIDIEHNMKVACLYINNLVKDLGDPPKEIQAMIQRATTYGNYYNNAFLKELQQSVEENEKYYEEYLGEDFFAFKMSVKNLIPNYSDDEREQFIVDNFKAFYEKLPKGKYFGQFGTLHVIKTERTDFSGLKDKIDTFANSINSYYEPLKGKVCSMIYEYGTNEYKGKELRKEIRMYTPEEDEIVYKIYDKVGKSKVELGDVLFILINSEKSPIYKVK